MTGERGMVERPVRLQLSRKKGFDLQATSRASNGLPAVNVARPSRYGNGFSVGEDYSYYLGPEAERATAEQCVTLYRTFRETAQSVDPVAFEQFMAPLRGRNLACWCALGSPCHADVLLELSSFRCDAALSEDGVRG